MLAQDASLPCLDLFTVMPLRKFADGRPHEGGTTAAPARGASEPVEQREGFLVNGDRDSPHIVAYYSATVGDLKLRRRGGKFRS